MRLTHPRTLRRVVPAAALALAAGLIAQPAAQAEPEVTVKSVEALFHQAETMNEQANQLGEDVKKTRREIADLTADVKKQQAIYDEQRRALGASLVQQQLDAPLGPTASLIGSGDPDSFIEGLGAVQALNATRADALDSFAAVARELDNRRKQLKEQEASLEADRKSAAAKQDKVQQKYEDAKAELARLTAPQQATFNTSNVKVDLSDIPPASGKGKAAVDFALAQLGDPYVYGGTGPDGWDCSGLVQASWAAAGVSLPRVVGPQMAATKSIPMSALQPGDIVAFSDMSHDGIYIGNGQVVHAPRPGKSVEIIGVGSFQVAGRVG